jgi:hypothetical protein
MKKLAIIMTCMSLLLAGCDKKDNTNDGMIEATITHAGFDFSKNLSGEDNNLDYNNVDGETIAWSPGPNTTAGIWGTGIWYRTAFYPVKMYKVGAVDISTVTNVDTTQWMSFLDDKPLRNGDVWVVMARDGFVKFQVMDAPTDTTGVNARDNWWVKVKYQFSATTTF